MACLLCIYQERQQQRRHSLDRSGRRPKRFYGHENPRPFDNIKDAEMDVKILTDEKLRLEASIERKAQELDNLTSRIQELETLLDREKEERQRITSSTKEFVKEYNCFLRAQDDLKRSEVRLQKLGEQLNTYLVEIIESRYYSKALNQKFSLSHSIMMGPTEADPQSSEKIKIPTAHYDFGANYFDPKLMLIGRVTTDAKLNARVKADLTDLLVLKANAHLTNDPHMSQAMFNFDYMAEEIALAEADVARLKQKVACGDCSVQG